MLTTYQPRLVVPDGTVQWRVDSHWESVASRQVRWLRFRVVDIVWPILGFYASRQLIFQNRLTRAVSVG